MNKPSSTSRPIIDKDNDSTDSFNEENRTFPPSLVGDIVMGLRFFSRLPTGNQPHETPKMGRIVPALGLTSVIIGLGSAFVFFVSTLLGLPNILAASFAVAAQILVTGAMAEDGVADSVDGIGGGNSPDQRLEIMKDSTHGTYGVLALILLVLVRVFALASLMEHSVIGVILLWLGAQVIARQSALWLMLALPLARPNGVAAASGILSKKAFGIGAVIASLIALAFCGIFVGIFGLIITAAIIVLIVGLWIRICSKLIGGYSGDLIGALQALVEIGALTTFIIVS